MQIEYRNSRLAKICTSIYAAEKKYGREMAEKIATRAPLAVEYGKKAVTAGFWSDPKTSAQVEIGLRSQLQETHDTQEAYHAFLEKRDPAPFIGK